MRIVGGEYKGRVLCEFKGDAVRPTADKVRESLFNILSFSVRGAKFLDLFSGTGAVGIEALSRGAENVTFNDLNRSSLDILRKNLSKLKIENGVKVYNADALAFDKACGGKFDIIFIDPPYKLNLLAGALETAAKLLEEDGIIVAEDEKPFNGEIKGLVKTDERKYGRVYLTFFKGE